MTKDHLAVLDACVLIPAALRDTLLRLAETPRLYVPKWSAETLNEVRRVLTGKLRKTDEQANHLVEQLTQAFPEAEVTRYQDIEVAMTNHPKDRHVLAAAVRCSAHAIVTFNIKHFPRKSLAPYELEAIHPDEFLVSQFNLDAGLVTTRLVEQSWAIGRTIEEQLRAFQRSKALPVFTQTLAQALAIKL